MPKDSRHKTGNRDLRYGNVNVFYKEYYARMPCGREGGSVAKLAHNFIERPFGPRVVLDEVLEVGAGDGLHLPFVRHDFRRYVMTDINEESLEMAKTRVAGGVESSLVWRTHRICHTPMRPSTGLSLLASFSTYRNRSRHFRSGGGLRGQGVVSIYVPSEPGLLTHAGRTVTTKREAKRAGFHGYDLMIAREHINHSWGLDQMIRHVFHTDDLRAHAWPIPRAPQACRAFTVYQATVC